MSVIVKLVTWFAFVGSIWLLLILFNDYFEWWQVYDGIFFLTLSLALALAITFSHSYGLPIEKLEKDELKKRAIKADATNIHAYFSWKIISAWMTIVPLYCTLTVVFISALYDGDNQMPRILIYSMLSLVISFSVYVVKPNYRAHNFIEQHRELRKVLLDYMIIETPSGEDKATLSVALGKAQEIRDDPF